MCLQGIYIENLGKIKLKFQSIFPCSTTVVLVTQVFGLYNFIQHLVDTPREQSSNLVQGSLRFSFLHSLVLFVLMAQHAFVFTKQIFNRKDPLVRENVVCCPRRVVDWAFYFCLAEELSKVIREDLENIVYQRILCLLRLHSQIGAESIIEFFYDIIIVITADIRRISCYVVQDLIGCLIRQPELLFKVFPPKFSEKCLSDFGLG